MQEKQYTFYYQEFPVTSKTLKNVTSATKGRKRSTQRLLKNQNVLLNFETLLNALIFQLKVFLLNN